MKVTNIHEAKTQLSRLVDEAAHGKVVIIGKARKPMVRLVPVEEPQPRKLGCWKGKVRIADDFDELPPEIMAAFRGEKT